MNAQIDSVFRGRGGSPEQAKLIERLRRFYVPMLIDDGRYDDAELLTRRAILAAPKHQKLLTAMTAPRARALLHAGRHDEALSAARAHYDVCDLAHTAQAVELVASVLQRTRPPGTAERFRVEQARLADPASLEDMELSDAEPADKPILHTLPPDPAPYADSLAKVEQNLANSPGMPPTYYLLGQKGNLLLLSGRPAEAKAVFEAMLPDAPNDFETNWCHEAVARAIRAEDGGVARANAYVLSLSKSPVDAGE